MSSKQKLAIIAGTVAVILGVIIWLSPFGGPSTVGTDNGVPVETAFSDFESFLEANEPGGRAATPVVFIGIDGASWRFMDPLIEDGSLPNLARLKRQGASGTLKSTACYVSPPAWVAMMTGYAPARTGVYTFGNFDRETVRFVSVNAEDIAVPSVWDAASYSGLNVGVVNVPVTYPVHEINGVMVSGIMTPNDIGPPIKVKIASAETRAQVQVNPTMRSYSTVLKTAAGDALNTFLISLYDTTDDGVESYDKVFVTVRSRQSPSGPSKQAGSATFTVGRFSPWFKILTVRGQQVVDGWCKLRVAPTPQGGYSPQVSPTLFRIDRPYVHPEILGEVLEKRFVYYMPSKLLGEEMVLESAEDAAAHASFFYDFDEWDLFFYVFTQSDNIHHVSGFTPEAVEVYKAIDRAIGDIVDVLPEDAVLFIGSDHGFTDYTYGIDLNRHLAKLGLLKWRSPGNIDYARSLVFHNLWHLYFNRDLITRAELVKHGVIVPDGFDPVQAFVDHLIVACKTLRSDDGSMALPVEITALPRTAGDPPDMLVKGTYNGYLVDFWNLQNPQRSVTRRLQGSERFNHTRDGIFLVWGNGVRRRFDAGVKNIEDIAPTILYLLDLPVAHDMQGQVMADVFQPGFVSRKPLFVVDDYAEIPREALVRDVDRESLEKKLRSLGYIR
jgi:predicted AlkP superfamily phosphohydrolase/phosphomutase